MGQIEVFNTVNSLQSALRIRGKGSAIGFVPTMGALHPGHMTLVREAMKQCDVVVVSIFVNPTQFDNPDDLENYPRELESDLTLLKQEGDVLVFTPTVVEIYPNDHQAVKIDLGKMGNVMEGKYRNGHFDGVVNVVHRLFEIVKPDFAYFGEKDFQQLAVIRYMTKVCELSVQIIGCPIYREPSGLAASSRNKRLSDIDKEKSLVIHEALEYTKDQYGGMSINEVKRHVVELFETSSLELEYFEIVDAESLQNLAEWTPKAHACIAAYCGDVRLIDNLQLYEGGSVT